MRRTVAFSLAFLLSLIAFSAGISPAYAQDVNALKPRVIVFVHGIHGNRDTWRAANGAYWPQLIQTDPHFQQSDVVVAEYPTPSRNGQYSTQQLSQILWKGLKDKHVWDHREVVFIAHSLGGLLTEEMLINHPADAARVRFIVSYSTPHQGSIVASLAKIYDRDPLLTDLSDSNDNSFLIDLEDKWRSTSAVSRIHRFCAYEALDTAAGEGVGRILRAHTRVVSYYSATYGCDVDTPPKKIVADHIDIVRPSDRSSDAYTFFTRVYHNNPVVNVVESVRDRKLPDLDVDCNKKNAVADLEVPVPLDPALHEQLVSAEAEFVDTNRVKDVSTPVVNKIDPNGIAHIAFAFKGKGRTLLLGCPDGHASLLVHFHIRAEMPVPE